MRLPEDPPEAPAISVQALRLASELADEFTRRLREVGRESDRLLGEMRDMRRRLRAEEAQSAERVRVVVAERDESIAFVQAQAADMRRQSEADQRALVSTIDLLRQEAAGFEARDREMVDVGAELHQAQQRLREQDDAISSLESEVASLTADPLARPPEHDHAGTTTQVIVLELWGTLTPSTGFVLQGQPGRLAPPLNDVMDDLDRWAGQGVCLHLITEALDPDLSPAVLDQRHRLISEWLTAHELPIGYVGGRTLAAVIYAEHAIPVMGGDWGSASDAVDDLLREVPPVPAKLEQEESSIPPVSRGLTTPAIEVDVALCGAQGAQEILGEIAEAGYQVVLTGASGIACDRVVTPEPGFCTVSCRAIAPRSWAKDRVRLLRLLRKSS